MSNVPIARILNLVDVEHDIEELLKSDPPPRESDPLDFAPPSVRAKALTPATVPIPDYVSHADGVSDIGKVTAAAVVKEYEAAAQSIEDMGAGLREFVRLAETRIAEAQDALAHVKETAQAYRDAGKRAFEEIEHRAKMLTAVKATCADLQKNVADTR